MRTILTFVLVSSFIVSLAQEMELDVKSTINQVTVFLKGAQVTRNASLSLKPGTSILTLKNIAPSIQEQSIQVDGPSSVKILSVSFRVNFMDELKKGDKIEALEDERKRLQAALTQENSVRDVYREEEAILKTNNSIGGTEKGVEIEELKIAMDYFRNRLMDIKHQLLLTEKNTKQYTEAITKIDAQLKEIRNIKEQPSGEIVVKVSTKDNVHAKFAVKYLVQEAHWYPSYDIRAKNVQSPISITYKANVNQQSGEDWNNVDLTISSGNPSEGGSKPIIKPWLLGFNNTVAPRNSFIETRDNSNPYPVGNGVVRGRILDDTGQPMPGVNVVIKGTTVGTVSDGAGYYSLSLTGDAQTLVFSFVGMQVQEQSIDNRGEIDVRLAQDIAQLSEVIVTAYSARDALEGYVPGISTSKSAPRIRKTIVASPVVRQTNVEYNLTEPFSVKSDGEIRSTEMVEYELDALYEYYCAPKLDADAFLTAKVLHWDEYNFLEGEASLFFEGKYIGKSILDTRNTTDTLTLSLGRDGNVLVKREKKKDYSSRQFIGSNQKITLSYEISVRNKKSQPITVVIADQIPVSTNKDIVVEKLEDSKGDYDHDSGLLIWRKEITAGKTELINLKYAIRYPKYNNMILE